MIRWIVVAATVLLMVLLVLRLTRKKPRSDELFRP
jgi:hypothetical protein